MVAEHEILALASAIRLLHFVDGTSFIPERRLRMGTG